MVPIYEQGEGRGIGHSSQSFLNNFNNICTDHINNNRAKSFAFLLYDFKDENFRRIITNLGVFARLDRLSSNKISLFYLHTTNKKDFYSFNESFLQNLEIENTTTPCVVFFDFDRCIKNIECVTFSTDNLETSFHELYSIIESKINNDFNNVSISKVTQYSKSTLKFVTLEAMSNIISLGFDKIFQR